jgi:uncharacterized protein DUF5680
MEGLEAFIVRAKATTYVGNGASRASSRPASHDIGHEDGDWSYVDSYFGGTDFLGQEVVWHRRVPVWAMNYDGRILQADRIDAAKAGQVIKQALSALYREGRFLGAFMHVDGPHIYVDQSEGDALSFTGHEIIRIDDDVVYRLDYHGGLIKP